MKSHPGISALVVLILIVIDKGTVSATCGQRSRGPVALIANGIKSNETDWPWHAAIFHFSVTLNVEYKCGGTIITPSAILTAAHCVHENGRRIIAERILVDLGKHVLTRLTNAQQFTVILAEIQSERFLIYCLLIISRL